MRELFRTIFSRDNIEFGRPGNKNTLETETVCVFFAVLSAVLTAMNVIKGYRVMAVTTAVLVAGFLVAAWFTKKGRVRVTRALISSLCGIVFSVYAVIGGNNGFAILWILLIPVIGALVVGLRDGFLLSAYFQLFLIALFYTPLRTYVQDYYTPTFIMRFPLLYAASFVSVTVMMCQRQRLYNEVHRQASRDGLTGLYNRRRFGEVIGEKKQAGAAETSVVAFDLNRLKYYNDHAGHEAGDEMLRGTAQLIRDAFDGDLCFRMGGDEFTVLSTRPAGQVRRSAENFRSAMREWKGTLVPELNVSLGCAFGDEHPGANLDELCRLADQEMYAEKERYYRETGVERRSSSDGTK